MHTLRLSVFVALTCLAASAHALENPGTSSDHPTVPPPPAVVAAALPAAVSVIQVDGQPIVVTLKGGKTVTLAPPIEMRAAVGKSPIVGFRSSQLPDPKKCQAPDWHVPAVLDTFANCTGTPIEALKCQSSFTAKRAALCMARVGFRPLDQNGRPLWVYVPARQKDNGAIFHYTAEEVAQVTDGDTDNDGVRNSLDKCPTVVGPAENNGCPYSDTDHDGLLDKDDKCPTVAGPIANEGCPYSDRDKDGIVDEKDACPEVAGVASDDPKLNGCPVKVATPAPAPEATPAAKPASTDIPSVKKPETLKINIGAGLKFNTLQPGQFAPCVQGGLQFLRVGGIRRLTLGFDGNFCYVNTGLPALRTHGIGGGVSVYAEGVLAKWISIGVFGGYDESRSLTEFNYTTIRAGIAGLQFSGYFLKHLMFQFRGGAAAGYGLPPGFPVAEVRAQFYGSGYVLYNF